MFLQGYEPSNPAHVTHIAGSSFLRCMCIPAALSSQDASRFAIQASRDSAISANSSCLAHPRAPPNASTPRTLDHASKGKFLHCLKRREEKSSVKKSTKRNALAGSPILPTVYLYAAIPVPEHSLIRKSLTVTREVNYQCVVISRPCVDSPRGAVFKIE